MWLCLGGPSPDVLNWAEVNVVSNEECSLPTHYPGSITGTMICAGGGDDFTETDTCQVRYSIRMWVCTVHVVACTIKKNMCTSVKTMLDT